jgi:hypothetical protein
MPEPQNPIYYQIISHMILDPKSYGILKEFFGALDKYEFEYEVDINMAQIKLKGHIIGSICDGIPEINFEQNKGKRINISYQSDYIEIIIFIYQKTPPIRIKIPKSWKISYKKSYLYIFFN